MAIESNTDLPFVPVRVFFVYGVASEKTRGQHAHRECHQFLVAVHGALSVVVDDGEHRVEVRLNTPTIGLHLPKMVWGTQYKFTGDAVLAVFASRPYESGDYIREYDAFLDAVHAEQAP